MSIIGLILFTVAMKGEEQKLAVEPNHSQYDNSLNNRLWQQNPQIALMKTVSRNNDPCRSNDVRISVPAGTDVYYCYKVTNTGDVPFTDHLVTDSSISQTQ